MRVFSRRYLLNPPRLEASLGAERVEGVTAVVQNAAPYTFFGNRPVHIGEGATLTSGTLSGVVLQRARPIDIPTVGWRALSERTELGRHRRVHAFSGVEALEIHSLDARPLPLQVDGDYIGEVDAAAFGVMPGGLLVVA